MVWRKINAAARKPYSMWKGAELTQLTDFYSWVTRWPSDTSSHSISNIQRTFTPHWHCIDWLNVPMRFSGCWLTSNRRKEDACRGWMFGWFGLWYICAANVRLYSRLRIPTRQTHPSPSITTRSISWLGWLPHSFVLISPLQLKNVPLPSIQSPTRSPPYMSRFAFFILPLPCLSSSFQFLVCMHPSNHLTCPCHCICHPCSRFRTLLPLLTWMCLGYV